MGSRPGPIPALDRLRESWSSIGAHGMKDWALRRTDKELMRGAGIRASLPMDGQRAIESPARGRTASEGGKGNRFFRARYASSSIFGARPARVLTGFFPVLPLQGGGAGFLFFVKGIQPKRRRGNTRGVTSV